MIRNLPGEKWKSVEIENSKAVRYSISNLGRLASYTEDIKDGTILKCSKNKGYRVFRYYSIKAEKKVHSHFYIHKKVAELFTSKPSSDKTMVIHLDYNKLNNDVNNLKWASKEEVQEHQKKNPLMIKSIKKLKEHNRTSKNGYKLSEAKVRIIKRKLLDPNRRTRIKMIARHYGVSEMQLYRIKTGENWGYVKVD
jgi:hypothetical protein